jgi:NADH:ubiquinone oxidoreductase subunit F (NADH-binding)
MSEVRRVLDAEPVTSLSDYDGGGAVDAARSLGPEAVIAAIAEAGLRGRGGAGFPTGRKWRTVRDYASPEERSTVVVNGAEGEPGCFKDRAILRANPYRVIEGALVAAGAVGANEVVIALKETFTQEARRVEAAVEEVRAAGWLDGVDLSVFVGPPEYLYGEETGLLEAIDGRPPFPRIAPPYRRGVEEIVDTPADLTSESSSAAHVELAGPGSESVGPPTLVDNVETIANVAGIVTQGADWFRSVGTEQSPGTIVVTISGATRRAGVMELAMGTPLADAIDAIGGGAREGRRLVAALPGVSGGLLPAAVFGTALTYEDMLAAGSGLGAGGYILLDDEDDLLAVAAGVSRFLAVESCGQCTPCKQDGLKIAELLVDLSTNVGHEQHVRELEERLETVADSARCNLASQQQVVVGSVLALFPDVVEAHHAGGRAPVLPVPILPIRDIVDGRAVLDDHQLGKQPDWSYGEEWSGASPADRFSDRRAPIDLE